MADTELVSGVHVEHPSAAVLGTPQSRVAYATAFASVVRAFMLEHLGFFEPAP